MFTSGFARYFSAEYSVVVLPLPVGPVTRMMPVVLDRKLKNSGSSTSENPSWSTCFSRMSGSKMRSTAFSPNAVGIVETRSSISRPPCSRLMRPSCGRRFSARLQPDSSLMRETIA